MASVSEPITPVSSQQDQVKPNAVPKSLIMTSLYVCDLDSSVTETQLLDFFAQAGQVLSVKISRDHFTKASRGYGYVNYRNLQDATNAMESLNFKPINGKSVRIMLSNHDSSIRKNGRANVFINGLESSIDSEALHEVFSEFGTILSCKVATDFSGLSKGYGYVQFDKDEDAKKAIREMNGMVVNGRQVRVGPFICKQERERERSEVRRLTLYVKNLPDSPSDGFLEHFFSKYGEVLRALIVRDKCGCSKGFGFVVFEEYEAAALAIEKVNGINYEGKVLYVGWAQSKSERQAELKSKFERERNNNLDNLQGSNLYVKNLDDSIHSEKLKELFSEFGMIRSCEVVVDSRGQSKGYGFVAFSSPGDASKAKKEMNGKMIGGKPLYVAVAQRKEERKAMLQARFAQVESPPPVTTAPFSTHAFHPVGPTRFGHQQQLVYFGGQGFPEAPPVTTAPVVPSSTHAFLPVGPTRFGPQQQQVYFGGQGFPGFQRQLLHGIPPGATPKYIMPYHHLQRQQHCGQQMY